MSNEIIIFQWQYEYKKWGNVYYQILNVYCSYVKNPLYPKSVPHLSLTPIQVINKFGMNVIRMFGTLG